MTDDPLDGVLSLSVPYGAKGSVLSVQVKLAGERLKPAHIAKVRKYLELAESDLIEWPDGELPEGRVSNARLEHLLAAPPPVPETPEEKP